MKPYNILLVVRHPVGGIRTFFRYVYTNFDPKRYRYTLIAPNVPETRVLLEDLRQLDLQFFATDTDISNGILARKVAGVLRATRFDLVHSHGFSSGVCSVPGALLSRTPHLLTCHDVFTARQFVGSLGALRRTALSIALPLVDAIHCVSYDARDNLLAYVWPLRLCSKRAIVIRNGIDVSRFRNAELRDLRRELGLPEDAFVIGFLGRFMSQKGFVYLVDALADIVRRGRSPRQPVLLCFGEDGFVREEIKNVERKGLSAMVHFLPFIPNVASTLKGMDVIVMPSLWEACGLLAMEAMVAGVPLVGTSCVGLREVLRGTPARVVPPGDSMALSKALVAEMNEPTTVKAREFVPEATMRFNVSERAFELEQLMFRFLGS